MPDGSLSVGDSETIEVPTEVTRDFPADRQDRFFEFAANKGDMFAVDIVSQRLGEPTDPRLIIQRIEPQTSGPPKLHNVLNVDDSQSIGDGVRQPGHQGPDRHVHGSRFGDLQLAVRDLDIGQTLSQQQRFELRVRQPNPGFDLVAYRMDPQKDAKQTQPVGTKLFRGGSEVIRVLALRRDGWNGPIRITAENLPPGVTAHQSIIAANQSATQITLTAAEDATASVGAIGLVGHSEDDKIVQRAVPATITWGQGGGRNFIRSRIAANLMLAVSAEDLSPLSITLGDASVAEVKKGQSISLPIKITRRDGAKDSMVVRGRDLPPGVSIGDVTIAADQSEASCEFKVNGGAAIGTYSIWMQAETKIKVKPNPQALAQGPGISGRPSKPSRRSGTGRAARIDQGRHRRG